MCCHTTKAAQEQPEECHEEGKPSGWPQNAPDLRLIEQGVYHEKIYVYYIHTNTRIQAFPLQHCPVSDQTRLSGFNVRPTSA